MRLSKTLFCGFTVQKRKKKFTAFVTKLGTLFLLMVPKLPDVSQVWGDAAHGQGNSFATARPSRQGVAEGKAFIAEQQRLIVELERDDCHDTAETMRLLEAFLVLQRSREEDRAKILDELSE